MTGQRGRFEKALGEDPKDWATRLVYADWLEENDLPEEADRQRKFRGAYEFLESLASRMGLTCTDYDPATNYGWDREACEPDPACWRQITVEDVIGAGDGYAENRDYFVQTGSEKARDLMAEGDNRRRYWACWSVVTGRPVPEPERWDGGETPAPFDCSC